MPEIELTTYLISPDIGKPYVVKVTSIDNKEVSYRIIESDTPSYRENTKRSVPIDLFEGWLVRGEAITVEKCPSCMEYKSLREDTGKCDLCSNPKANRGIDPY